MTRAELGKKDIRAQIDAFLKAPKTLVGTAQWQQGNRPEERRAVWPVMIDGKLVNASLQATAYPNESERRFTIGLYWPDCIWRLDFEPNYKRHPNPIAEVQRRGLDARIAGPHYHSWADNRHLVKGRVKELPCARPFGNKKMTWASCLRWFCGETNISLTKDQMLEFPRKDRLL